MIPKPAQSTIESQEWTRWLVDTDEDEEPEVLCACGEPAVVFYVNRTDRSANLCAKCARNVKFLEVVR